MVQETGTTLHFRELASMLLTAAILHVCYTSRRPSLASVWHFLTQQHRTLGACLNTMLGTRHTPSGVHPTIAQFTQAIRNKLLKGRAETVFEERWNTKGLRGTYTAIATLRSENHPVETSVEFVLP